MQWSHPDTQHCKTFLTCNYHTEYKFNCQTTDVLGPLMYSIHHIHINTMKKSSTTVHTPVLLGELGKSSTQVWKADTDTASSWNPLPFSTSQWLTPSTTVSLTFACNKCNNVLVDILKDDKTLDFDLGSCFSFLILYWPSLWIDFKCDQIPSLAKSVLM